MPIYVNSNLVTKIYIGIQSVSYVYFGTNLVFFPEPIYNEVTLENGDYWDGGFDGAYIDAQFGMDGGYLELWALSIGPIWSFNVGGGEGVFQPLDIRGDILDMGGYQFTATGDYHYARLTLYNIIER